MPIISNNSIRTLDNQRIIVYIVDCFYKQYISIEVTEKSEYALRALMEIVRNDENKIILSK